MKIVLLFIISFIVVPPVFCQSILKVLYTTDGLNNKIKEWKIEALKPRKDDGKVEKAINDQLGLIGNDYFKEEYIGKGSIEQEQTRNTRYAIDGYKRTIMGKVTENYFRIYNTSSGAVVDPDDDYHISVEAMTNDPLLIKNMARLREEVDEDFNKIKGEIDIHQASKHNYLIYKDDMPARSIDYACLYGPWIADRGAYGLGNQSMHGSYLEIHPAEQIWWTEKKTNERVYSLLAINDNSGRFDNRSDYDAASEYVLPWTPKTLISTFAIPFSVKLKDGIKQFNLLSLYDKNVHPSVDVKSHVLKYNGKILVKFSNWSPAKNFTEVSFDNVGLDTKQMTENEDDSVVTGFIILKSKIGSFNNTDVGGNLFMIVTETNNIKDKMVASSLQTEKLKVKVVLSDISCINSDDGDAYEDIFGLIGARMLDAESLPIVSNLLPTNSNTPLFWSALDGLALKLKKGDKKIINKQFIYECSSNGIITLVADLNEDDNNDDSNPTMSDGLPEGWGWLKHPVEGINTLFGNDDKYKDDVLEKFCGVCEENIIAGRLDTGLPVKKKFQFASGGTLIEVNFVIERLR